MTIEIKTPSFDEWKARAQAEFSKHGWPDNYVEQVHDSTWREIYDFDPSDPEDAAREEMSCL